MDWKHAQRWFLAMLCILFAGCTVCENARRTVCDEPSEFFWKKDKRRSMALYSRWADEAWQEELQGCPDLLERPDYAIGFRDGFVDFVWAGGTGEPPPVPPRKLWNVAFRSDDGHRRTMEWYEGYRHGAGVARDGGYRSMATLRSSLFGIPEGGPSYYRDELRSSGPVETEGQWIYSEELPAPDANALPALRAPAMHEGSKQAPQSEPDRVTPDNTAAEHKPQLPPVSQNLPPTAPVFESDELELHVSPTDPEAPANEDSSDAATQRQLPSVVGSEAAAPRLLQPTPAALPAQAESAIQSPASQPTVTSVRFVGVSSIATNSSPPSQPETQAPPRVRQVRHETSLASPFSPRVAAIRLAVGALQTQPPASQKPVPTPTSTITIHQAGNSLRGPVSLPPALDASEWVR